MKELDFVGKDVPRVDAEVKVTGEAIFSVDVTVPNMLWGRLLRSPLPHARILNIDTSRAERTVGVKAVITGQEPPFVFGESHRDQTHLQAEKAGYVGDTVAAVAAVDVDTALEASRVSRWIMSPCRPSLIPKKPCRKARRSSMMA